MFSTSFGVEDFDDARPAGEKRWISRRNAISWSVNLSFSCSKVTSRPQMTTSILNTRTTSCIRSSSHKSSAVRFFFCLDDLLVRVWWHVQSRNYYIPSLWPQRISRPSLACSAVLWYTFRWVRLQLTDLTTCSAAFWTQAPLCERCSAEKL